MNSALRKALAWAAATVVTLAAGTAYADGSITFIHGGLNDGTAVNNGNVFNIDLINGATTDVFVNKTGKTILDFHFEWTGNLAVKGFDDLPGGGVTGYFGSYQATQTSLDFYDKAGGVGIAPNEKFTISLSGFGNITPVKANATFLGGKGAVALPVPEPANYLMTLVGLGLVGVVVRRRARAAG